MKRIVLIVAVFLATVFTGDRLVSFSAEKILCHSQNQFVRMYEGKQPAEILFLGDSRVDRNISFEKVRELTGKRCLNLGLGGNSPLVSEALLKDYLQRYPKPDLIVVELGHSAVNPATLGEMRIFSYCSTNIQALAEKMCPTYTAFSKFFTSLRFNDPAFWRMAGEVFGQPAPRLLNNKIPPSIINAWKQGGRVDRPIYQANMDALRRIVDLADAHQIRVELIITPCWHSFRKAIVNFAEWKAVLQRSSGNHPVKDYSDTFIDFPDYFNDELHLNAVGAEHFVLKLEDDRVL